MIPLSKAGFDGDIDNLFVEIGSSMYRYEKRMAEFSVPQEQLRFTAKPSDGDLDMSKLQFKWSQPLSLFIAAPIKRGFLLPKIDFSVMLYLMKKEDKQKGTDDNEGIVFEKDPSSDPADLDTDQADLDANLDDSVVAEENSADAIKKLREKLKKSEAERQEYLTGWQRAKADLINARKRDEVDRMEFLKFANERLIDGLIPVLDSFELAMNNKEVWEKAEKNWRTGVESIAGQLKKALSDAGLEEVNPVGQKFDPMRDEAASYEPVDSEDKNHVIINVVQKGYNLNGRPMRPAKVRVGEFKT